MSEMLLLQCKERKEKAKKNLTESRKDAKGTANGREYRNEPQMNADRYRLATP
jgi:hypothetical protein